MSKVSSTHWELANAARWLAPRLAREHGIDPASVEISGRVERYHRDDGYRDINITARSRPFLAALAVRLRDSAAAIERDVRVYIDIGGSVRSKEEHILSLSIWPGSGRAEKAVVELQGA